MMTSEYIVKQPKRPQCGFCGAKCGHKYKHWPNNLAKAADWDGESWVHPYNPFCTLRCALRYARKAWTGGEDDDC